MATKPIPYKIYLSEDEIPKQWYNLNAVMQHKHEPFLNPATLQPCKPEELKAVFCDECVEQELNRTDVYIDIPEDIRSFYKMYRPSPLVRAYVLEQALGTPAHIYYKFEGNNTSGSHKLNSAVAQAYYAKKQGLKSVTTETGAGQWGTALSMACAFYGLDLSVYMVKVSSEQKPYRKEVMRTYGAKVIPSPSDTQRSTVSSKSSPARAVRSAAPSARRSKRRSRRPLAAMCSAACSTTSCCTNRSSASRARRRWINTACSRISSSAASAAAPTTAA